jgi:sulfite reductase (NADPH) flavoprotein alpha-component
VLLLKKLVTTLVKSFVSNNSLIQILFGSQTGNAENLSRVIQLNLLNEGIESVVSGFDDHAPESVSDMDYLIIVTSTYGDGEAPDNASEWHSYLKFSEGLELGHLNFAVLGLGDTYYPHFCQCGKDFDEFLSAHGAQRMLARLDCDTYYEEQYGPWLNELIAVLKNKISA